MLGGMSDFHRYKVQVELALAGAKKVQRENRMIVRALAQLLDELDAKLDEEN